MKKTKLNELINFDLELWDHYKPDLMIGVDEVGRGCLAGPLYTAAFGVSSRNQLSKFFDFSGLEILNDSKKVPKKLRPSLCSILKSDSLSKLKSISFQEASSVDSYGIVDCIWSSMKESLEMILKIYFNEANKEEICFSDLRILVLVDGPKEIPNASEFIQIPVIKGDNKSALIAAASNLAKEARDEYMKELSRDYDFYSWESNVGYGTKKHLEMILSHGISPHHRMSFLGRISNK